MARLRPGRTWRGRLVAIIRPDNTASQRVAEKIGLPYERDAVHGGVPVRVHAAGLGRGDGG
ncbi:MAG TPA: hypothetical protein VGN37_14875 [Actinocatenispora sp.]